MDFEKNGETMNKYDLWMTEPRGDVIDQTKKEKIDEDDEDDIN